MDRINVVVVIKSLGLGGAERLLVDSLPYLDRGRFLYQTAYMVPWKDALVPAIAAEGVRVLCIGGSRKGYGVGSASVSSNGFVPSRSLRALTLMPVALRRLLDEMRSSECDLLQADLPAAGLVARIAGRRMGVPVVYTEHNLQERYHPLTRWANGATFGWNDVVLAVSDEVAASIELSGAHTRTSVRTLPNGVPVETIRAEAAMLDVARMELHLPIGTPVVGTVAVMRPQKRLADWLAVARRVTNICEDAQFLLVGDGPDMPMIMHLVRKYGLEGRVRLTGFREDGRRLIGLMDVFLMTSEYEGLPVAMLEAMALGRPIVATRVGGIPEVVEPGRHGLLADTGEVDLLASHVCALLSNPAVAHEMGRNGAELVKQQYHTRNRVRAIEEIYTETVAKRSTSQ